jgi:AcrR family transcriptional regulator
MRKQTQSEPSSDEKLPIGRSARQENRREEFLQAATEVFFRSGFARASVDEVVAKVGGSKRTIYSYFGNKEQLFTTVIQEISRRAMGQLAQEDICRENLETTLLDVGQRYLEVIMSPEALHLYRTVVAEGDRFPGLAQVFFDAGPGRASASLARVLRQMSSAWGIQGRNYDQLAEHFLGMIRDDLHLKVVLGLRPPPDPSEAESSVHAAVTIFVKGARRSK